MHNKTNLAIAAVTICLSVIAAFAVATQDFSWWAIPFVLLFGTIFGSVLVFCYATFREDNFERAAKEKHPNEPWMWDANWQSATIPARNKSDFRGSIAASVVLSMFALMGFAALWENLPDGNLWVLLYVIPIVAAGYFIQYTYRAWLSYRFERQVSLILDTLPAWIGSGFRAQLSTLPGFATDTTDAKLEYTRVEREVESDGEVSFTKVIDRTILCEVDHADGKVAITADIPSKSPETPWGADDTSGWWELIISLNSEGKDLELRYRVPIADPSRHGLPNQSK